MFDVTDPLLRIGTALQGARHARERGDRKDAWLYVALAESDLQKLTDEYARLSILVAAVRTELQRTESPQ